MNRQLWNEIEAFDLDAQEGDYAFSIRLAHENRWTSAFTAQAILEYKKFMYLAAISGTMVSPSEIVDIVWHQHLIFTQSYSDLCKLLGRQIEHIPSTHNKGEHEKFLRAKQVTKELYVANFGSQPQSVWEYETMLDSLHMPQAKYNIGYVCVVSVLSLIVVASLTYSALLPVYANIDNPYFINTLIPLAVLIFILLNYYNNRKLCQILDEADAGSFVNKFTAFELLYLKTDRLSTVIHGWVNQLILKKIIDVNPDGIIEIANVQPVTTTEEKQILNVIESTEKQYYMDLLRNLHAKHVFNNISTSIDAFKNHFLQSKKLWNLLVINIVVYWMLCLIPLIRVMTGMARHKHVDGIGFVTCIIFLTSAILLYRLPIKMFKKIIPDKYKYHIIQSYEKENNWQWIYCLLGTSVLVIGFSSIADAVDRRITNSGGSSCGSGCGSSCGSSCGGCGGGD